MQIAYQRLSNQKINSTEITRPEEVVKWFGMIQAEDANGAEWAVGLRSIGLNATQVNDALAQGKILRSHAFRPTWHYVLAEDIRWLLALNAPKLNQLYSPYYSKLGLWQDYNEKANLAIRKALSGNQRLGKAELRKKIKWIGVSKTDKLKYEYVLIRSELDGVLCCVGQKSNEPIYALLDEVVPPMPVKSETEAIVSLARYYFRSRGPASLKDFSWWSGLTLAEAKKGLEDLSTELSSVKLNRTEYWFFTNQSEPTDSVKDMFLLPKNDEFVVGYEDKTVAFKAAQTSKVKEDGNVLFSNSIIKKGEIIGSWSRRIYQQRNKKPMAIKVTLFDALSTADYKKLLTKFEEYSVFCGHPLEVVITQ